MNVQIRAATTSDLSAILDIVNDAILNTTADYRYDKQSLDDIIKWYDDRLSKCYPVLVADREGVVLGYASYSQFRERIGFRFCMEHSIYVLAGFTGNGVGSLLLKELIRHCRAQGHHTMIACIDSANSGSIVFHKKNGFEHIGEMKQIGRKFDRWLDMTIMQLTLLVL